MQIGVARHEGRRGGAERRKREQLGGRKTPRTGCDREDSRGVFERTGAKQHLSWARLGRRRAGLGWSEESSPDGGAAGTPRTDGHSEEEEKVSGVGERERKMSEYLSFFFFLTSSLYFILFFS